MSVTLELDQCFLCMEFIGNLTDVHSNSEIEVFFRSIGVQFPDKLRRSELLMCDNCMSSALNLKIVIGKYASSVQSRVELLKKGDTDSEEEVNECSAKPEVKRAVTVPVAHNSTNCAMERDHSLIRKRYCMPYEETKKFQCVLCLKLYKSQKGLEIHRCSRKLSECRHCHEFFASWRLKGHMADCIRNIEQTTATVPNVNAGKANPNDEDVFEGAIHDSDNSKQSFSNDELIDDNVMSPEIVQVVSSPDDTMDEVLSSLLPNEPNRTIEDDDDDDDAGHFVGGISAGCSAKLESPHPNLNENVSRSSYVLNDEGHQVDGSNQQQEANRSKSF